MTDTMILFNFSLAFLFISMNSYILYLVLKFLKSKKSSKSPIRKPKAKKPVASAKNNVMNAAVDFQKIKTAEIEIPVIAEDVLTYGPGELGAAYPETTNLYYPESAISDDEYLETVVRSPLQVQTHEKNTSEYNRDVDGWPLSAWYDKDKKRVMVKGVLHGEDNVAYAKENLSKPGFGTSAFISFLKIERQKGTAPNGKPYDAIVKKAVNNHIAILPNIRDPKNVIVALNAVEDKDEDATESKNKEEEIETGEDTMTQEQFNAMMDTYQAKNKEKDELKNSIKNEILEEIKKGEGEEKNGKNESESEKTDIVIEKKEEEKEAANSDEPTEDKEDADAANSLAPSEEMLRDFSTHLGISFKTTPSLRLLAKTVGVEAKNTAELISALNAKRKEITSGTTQGEGKNSDEKKASFDDLLKTI